MSQNAPHGRLRMIVFVHGRWKKKHSNKKITIDSVTSTVPLCSTNRQRCQEKRYRRTARMSCDASLAETFHAALSVSSFCKQVFCKRPAGFPTISQSKCMRANDMTCIFFLCLTFFLYTLMNILHCIHDCMTLP